MNLTFRLIAKILAAFFGLAITASIAAALFALSLLPDLPDVESVRDVRLKVPLRIYSAEGGLIAEFGEERREPVTIEQVPKLLIQAVLAAEDDSFYSHPGVDFLGVARAALANLRSGGHEQGASTITMQVARNYFLSPEKTYTRKLKEVLLAFRLERALTKEQILELYLNKIFLGHRAYGFAAAARVYYGTTLDELALPQIAMLAGLPKAPSRDNPISNPERARDRRDYVLRRMHKLRFVDDAQLAAAVGSPLIASKHIAEVDVEAPYVAEMVRSHMIERYGEETYWRGYKVYTTVNDKYQHTAITALRNGIKAYDRRHGYRGPVARHQLSDATTVEELDQALREVPTSGELIPAIVIATKDGAASIYTRAGELGEIPLEAMIWARRFLDPDRRGPKPAAVTEVVAPGDIVYVERDDEQGWRLSQLPAMSGALVSVRPSDGALLALQGGFDFYLSKFNRVIQAERQPGSNIKPFLYSAALDHGFTPATLVSGAPIVVEDVAQNTLWRPENYSGKFFGPTRLRRALSLSLNLVSVRVVRSIGIHAALDHLVRFGFERERLPDGLSLALGSGTTTPLTVVTAYSVFANGGYRVEPYFIEWVEDIDGEIIEQARPTVVCVECLSDRAAAPETITTNLPAHRLAPRVLDADNHFLITSMLSDVIRSGTGRAAKSLGRKDLAGKTGTTNDFRDAWFSGFNRDVVTTVWVGFDDSASLGRGEAGSKAALPIWIDYMRVALAGKPERWFERPDNVVTEFVHPDTGQAVAVNDPNGYREYFKVGTEPQAAGQGTFTGPARAAGGPGGAAAIPDGLF